MTTTEPADRTTGAAPDDVGVLLRLVAQNAELLDEVRELRSRIDRLEADRGTVAGAAALDGVAAADPAANGPTPEVGSALDAPTSRRTLLTRGAAVAAAAVTGTAAVGLATAQPAAAASGTFDGDPAVSATSSGEAVIGTSLFGNGIHGVGTSAAAVGVMGESSATTAGARAMLATVASPDGYGLLALNNALTGKARAIAAENPSTAGIAIEAVAASTTGATTGVLSITSSIQGIAVKAVANANGVGVASQSDRAQLRLDGSPVAPPSSPLARTKGELVFDTNADLWLCVAAGTPGTWRKLAGPATAGAFTVLPSTVRIYDSRAGLNPTGVPKGQLGNFAERTIDAKTNGAVPAGATAVLVNLTIVNTGSPGYLGLFKNGITWPGNTTINWNQPGTLLANSAICALDDQARFAVKSNVGFCDFVIDAIGYYR